MKLRDLLGSTALRAPEDDRGFTQNEDVDHGEGLDAEVDDEIDEDEGLGAGEGEGGADRGEEADDGVGDDEARQRQNVRQPSRAERRVQSAVREAKEAKEEAGRIRQELADIRAGQDQNRQRESQADRAQRLALMEPEERTDFLLSEQRQQQSGEIARLRFEMADRDDRADFRADCANNPVLAKYKDKVEEVLATERRAGRQGPSRAIIAKYLIGEEAINKATRASGKQRAAAGRTVERQTARPGAGRSDSGRGDRAPKDDRAARAERLKDVNI